MDHGRTLLYHSDLYVFRVLVFYYESHMVSSYLCWYRKSYCFLLYSGPLGEIAKERLTVMRDTEDGFIIAEKDLEPVLFMLLDGWGNSFHHIILSRTSAHIASDQSGDGSHHTTEPRQIGCSHGGRDQGHFSLTIGKGRQKSVEP